LNNGVQKHSYCIYKVYGKGIIMNSLFNKLDKEKQERVINASLHVFSKNDFKHGSTDDIAAEAKIAKGSLFLYFKNKKTLYQFIYEYSLVELSKKADESFNFEEKDFFEILKQSMEIKFDLLKRYPYLYQFVIKANEESNPEVAELIQEVNRKIQPPRYEKIYSGVDYSKFKENTDFENLNKMISWCSEGIWNEGVKNQNSVELMHQKALDLIDFFRKAVYKEEYLGK
jgi:TetR/AcrR family transcriptional regulator